MFYFERKAYLVINFEKTYQNIRIIVICGTVWALTIETRHSYPRREALVLLKFEESPSGYVASPDLLDHDNILDFVL